MNLILLIASFTNECIISKVKFLEKKNKIKVEPYIRSKLYDKATINHLQYNKTCFLHLLFILSFHCSSVDSKIMLFLLQMLSGTFILSFFSCNIIHLTSTYIQENLPNKRTTHPMSKSETCTLCY